jgi:hypothetical protein
MTVIRHLCSAIFMLLIASGPALSWSVTSSAPVPVANTANIPYWWLYPDGHLSVLPSGDPAYPWMMFWSEFKSYRTLETNQTPEGQKILSPKEPVFGEESAGTTAGAGFTPSTACRPAPSRAFTTPRTTGTRMSPAAAATTSPGSRWRSPTPRTTA